MKHGVILLALLVAGCTPRWPVRGEPGEAFRSFARETPSLPETLRLTFFEVGIGDAILVELPSGRNLLIDAGIGWQAGRILAYLQERGTRRLDGLLLTHGHIDHYGGMEKVVRAMPVGTFYHNGVPGHTRAYRRLEAALDARGVRRRILSRGDWLDELTGGGLAGSGVSLEVLYPDEEALAGPAGHNHRSIVLSLRHGELGFLLTGDCEWAEEKRLLQLEGERLAAHQVLKLGHHSSPRSGSEEFLRTVSPALAVVQGCEIINVPLFYPRPNYRIRRVLRSEEAMLLNTARERTIQLLSDGRSIEVRTERGRRERWSVPESAPVTAAAF